MNSKTEKNLWRFRGNADVELAAERVEPNLFSNLIGATSAVGKVVRCGENREGVESDIDIEIAPDDLIEVELDDGLKLYLSASRFEELVKPRASRSGDDNIKTIPGRAVAKEKAQHRAISARRLSSQGGPRWRVNGSISISPAC